MTSLRFDVHGADELQRKLHKAAKKVDMIGWMQRSCLRVQTFARTKRFRKGGSGVKGKRIPPVPDILTERTTRLRNAIASTIDWEGKDIIGRVGVSFAVKYAAIHEYGGIAGRGAVIPARPYLQPALEASREEIEKDLNAMISNALTTSGLK